MPGPLRKSVPRRCSGTRPSTLVHPVLELARLARERGRPVARLEQRRLQRGRRQRRRIRLRLRTAKPDRNRVRPEGMHFERERACSTHVCGRMIVRPQQRPPSSIAGGGAIRLQLRGAQPAGAAIPRKAASRPPLCVRSSSSSGTPKVSNGFTGCTAQYIFEWRLACASACGSRRCAWATAACFPVKSVSFESTCPSVPRGTQQSRHGINALYHAPVLFSALQTGPLHKVRYLPRSNSTERAGEGCTGSRAHTKQSTTSNTSATAPQGTPAVLHLLIGSLARACKIYVLFLVRLC